MDVERLAKSLEPLMPNQVRHWLRARDLADAGTRALIENQIVSVAYQRLGDFRSKPLLSLPPREIARRSIRLGTILYEADKWEFGVSPAELLRNMAIFGMSGSGKTNLAFLLLRQLVRNGVAFLFWDWKRTARHLIPELGRAIKVYTPGRTLSPFPFNPFIPPPGLEPTVYLNHVVDVMADAYTLGDGSKRILQKAIAACYERGNMAPSANAILSEVASIPDQERVKGWKVSAMRALESLAFSNLTGEDAAGQKAFAEGLLQSSTIVELDALSQGAKKFLVPLMSLWVYYVQLGTRMREQLKLVIFVEEAHHVLYRQENRAKEPVLNMLIRQCREIGIGVVVIDQHPHLISTAALGNSYAVVCLNQRDPTDVNKASALCMIDGADKRWFSMLPVGHAIVKLQGRWLHPFVIRIPHVEVRKGSVTDDRLASVLNGTLSLQTLRRTLDQEFPRRAHPSEQDAALDPDSVSFLEDVLAHEDDGIRVRYSRLGLSGDKGNQIKQRLVETGILEEQELKVGRTRKLLLRPTPLAKGRFGLTKTLGRGSVAHEYWKRFYAETLRSQGYHVELEAPRPGGTGRVDALARRGTESLAVEVETGKSNVVENVRQDLRAGFSRVLVVATDDAAMKTVESSLSRAGLFIPGRVQMVLGDSQIRPL